MSASLLKRIKSHRHYPELSKFAVVGGMGYASDVIVFNVLRSTTSLGPISAKALSLTVSIVVSFIGNRQWTYRERASNAGSAKIPMQGLIFVGVTVIGMGIQMAFLGFSHYVLGFTSLLADNISGNLLGMAVATAFRFWGYRTWVFRHTPPGATEPAAAVPGQAVPVEEAPAPEAPERDTAHAPEARVRVGGEDGPAYERSVPRPRDPAGTDR
ncbi:GtrA family protein [Yinghuangia sp. ASG 101]|uniref:GtrA family protein n=1 Tax=Yinghuangia sp. ASG 101 TaxID=2896848 RepID=UPI001E4EF8CC|nr:GtrA family protein [Yinghuangia sp. ASG 101]UGQ09694.1 GtrA family protein [Yinghuangia sp. ASG 101]